MLLELSHVTRAASGVRAMLRWLEVGDLGAVAEAWRGKSLFHPLGSQSLR